MPKTPVRLTDSEIGKTFPGEAWVAGTPAATAPASVQMLRRRDASVP
jgi:hypothetical protein